MQKHPGFKDKLKESGVFPLTVQPLEIFQVNLGKMCNQTCRHCHVDAGPTRKEIMKRETMQQCLDALKKSNAHTVDLTGGAPEMNPDFRWFVEELSRLGKKIIVRCNLTIILANKKFNDLPDFFKRHKVNVVSSLPFYEMSKTDRQRGDGVFAASIKALQMLNAVGYGRPDTGLQLDLVYNPAGAFLPGAQAALESDFKKELKKNYDIEFSSLFTITNMPIARYKDYLHESGNFESYMEKLISSFNPQAAKGVMCRNTLSVGWDGLLYDCDFNQMLDLKIESASLRDFDGLELQKRAIIFKDHCFGCTAGAGSSCGGATS